MSSIWHRGFAACEHCIETCCWENPAETKYTEQPETLAYESKKILGFYDSNYSFEFDKTNIEVLMEVTEYYGEKRVITKEHFTSYDILQPIQLPELDQQGELKMLNKIPAFYLKAFDDRNSWTNFEKTAWLTLDTLTTFTGIGNIFKLRHLRHLSKLKGAIVILGSLQVASGVLGIMLNYLEVCKDKEFCDKLRVYLFWFDLASFGTDAILEKMLRKSAKEALEKADKLNKQTKESKEFVEIATHLDETSIVINSFEDVYQLKYFRPSGLYKKLPRGAFVERYGPKASNLFDAVERQWTQFQKLLKTGNERGAKVLVSGMMDTKIGIISKVFPNFTKKEIDAGLHLKFLEKLHPTLKKRLELHWKKRGPAGRGLNIDDPDVIKYAWGEIKIAHAEFRALDDLLWKIDKNGKLGETVFENGRIVGYNSFLRKPGIQHTCADCFYLTHGVTFLK